MPTTDMGAQDTKEDSLVLVGSERCSVPMEIDMGASRSITSETRCGVGGG